MAAHLEARGASVLDFTGFAQKFGPVLSYVRLAATPDELNQVRIDATAADALIGCDIVVSSSPKASAAYRPGMKAAVNLAEMPTGDVIRSRDASLRVDQRLAAIRQAAGENVAAFDANRASEKLLGDTVFANVMMLGFAWQNGLVPVSLEALRQAIELNGVAIEANHRAFLIGRIAAASPEKLGSLLAPPKAGRQTLDQIVTRREAFLTDYQDAAYAARYRSMVDRVRAAEAPFRSEELTTAVAKSLFRLMAYKDEYEVARLHTQTGFANRIAEQFEGDYRVVHHLAPPILNSGIDHRGRPLKRDIRPVDPDAVPRACADEAAARHAVRPLRLHGRAAHGARPDRLVRRSGGGCNCDG